MKRNKLSIKTDDWKTFDKNNPAIALSILYIKEKEICPSYISKIILNCEKKKKILLMIPNEEEKCWHYLALKRLSALLRGIS